MKYVIPFCVGAGGALCAFLIILLFRYYLRKGRQIRRSVFILTITAFMTIYGLASVLILNGGLVLTIVITSAFFIWGLMISAATSMALYNRKS